MQVCLFRQVRAVMTGVQFVLSAALFFGCSNSQHQKENTEADVILDSSVEKTIQNPIKKVHSLYDSAGNLLGDIYLESSFDSLGTFDKLIVVKEDSIVYSVNKFLFSNTVGIDSYPMDTSDFYGYRLIEKEREFFTLYWYTTTSKISSGADPITVGWNYNKKLFEIYKF